MATSGADTLDTASLQTLLGPQLTAEQAALIFQQGQEAVVFALLTLAKQPWEQRHARRLVKRMRWHASELFTFQDHPEVLFDNNHGERQIRPAVIARKNSSANGSEDGAETQAMLMSVLGTLKQRGHNAVSAVTQAVRAYLQTGQLPSLPGPVAEIG